MNSTIYYGASGIRTHQFGVDSQANNIANVNTTGYRANVPMFSTIFSSHMDHLNANSTVSNDNENGATVASNTFSTAGGSYKDADDSPFNVALYGKGWFVVGENKNGTMRIGDSYTTPNQSMYYTRDGGFGLDAEAYLVNDFGGYMYGIDLGKIQDDGTFQLSQDAVADTEKLSGTQLVPLRIPQEINALPMLTTKADVAVNLSRERNLTPVDNVFKDADGNLDKAAFLQNDMNTLFTSNEEHLDMAENGEFSITLTYGSGTTTAMRKALEEAYALEGDADAALEAALAVGQAKAAEYGKNETQIALASEQLTSAYEAAIEAGSGALAALQSALAQDMEQVFGDVERTESYDFAYGTDFKSVGEFMESIAAKTQGKLAVDFDALDSCEFSFSNASDEAFDVSFSADNQFLELLGITQAPATLKPDNPGSTITTGKMLVPYYQTNLRVFDDQGAAYRMETIYRLTDYGTSNNDQWHVSTAIYDEETGGVVSDAPSTGVLGFSSDGTPSYTGDTSVDFGNFSIAFNPTGANGQVSTNRLYKDSSVVATGIDGNPPGQLKNVSIDGDGIITLHFTNNLSEPMGRIGIAGFVNDQGLRKTGSNMFEMVEHTVNGESTNISGDPLLMWNVTDGHLKNSEVLAGKLETSNVDMTTALTELIVMQRGYSAAAKTFSTGDEMLKEAINLKR